MAAHTSRGFFATPLNGALVGLVLGAVVVVIMTITGGSERVDSGVLPYGEAKDAEAFVDAWSAMLSGTWYREATSTRTVASGQTSSSGSAQVQQGSSSVIVASGSISVIDNGRQTVCALPVDGAQPKCSDGGLIDRQQTIAHEVSAVQGQVLGDRALYGVLQREDQCFELRPTSLGLTPPQTLAWGTNAVFCFDPATRALSSSRVVGPEAVDVFTASVLRANVTPDDFARLRATGS